MKEKKNRKSFCLLFFLSPPPLPNCSLSQLDLLPQVVSRKMKRILFDMLFEMKEREKKRKKRTQVLLILRRRSNIIDRGVSTQSCVPLVTRSKQVQIEMEYLAFFYYCCIIIILGSFLSLENGVKKYSYLKKKKKIYAVAFVSIFLMPLWQPIISCNVIIAWCCLILIPLFFFLPVLTLLIQQNPDYSNPGHLKIVLIKRLFLIHFYIFFILHFFIYTFFIHFFYTFFYTFFFFFNMNNFIIIICFFLMKKIIIKHAPFGYEINKVNLYIWTIA